MLRSLLSSRLGRRITLAVACSILLVEAVILIPSYQRRLEDQLARCEATARAALLTAFAHRHDDEPATMLAHAAMTLRTSPVRSATLYDSDGRVIGSFGETPRLLRPADPASPMGRLSEDGRRYEFLWPAAQTGLPITVVGRLDSSGIGTAMTTFVLHIAGVVLIITAFVILVTMLVVERSVLRPVLALSRGLAAARGNSQQAEAHVPPYAG
ncbi:MAG TPA: hypothetical protein VE631_03195, partial [Alphaproteobacteria bacterium]|nr:hypothetical protein [Alphaproteobacteria bacterium]